MGENYNRNFEKSHSLAFRTYITDLRANQSLLVDAGLYSAKEIDDKVEELLAGLKAGGDEGKKSIKDVFSEWLNEPAEEHGAE